MGAQVAAGLPEATETVVGMGGQLRCGTRAEHATSAQAKAVQCAFRLAGKLRLDVLDDRGRPWGRHNAVAPHTVDSFRA